MTESFIAEVEVTHPDLPLAPTIEEMPDAAIELESQPLTEPDPPVLFYSVAAVDFEGFDGTLDDDRTVRDYQVPIASDDCRLYKITLDPDVKFTSDAMTAREIRALTIRSADRGWRLQLLAPDRERLGSFWEYCRREDLQFSLEKLYNSGPSHGVGRGDEVLARLTERQREVARTAIRMGYYEREGASAREVAAELDISPSTLSTHLRRVTATVFRELFGE